MNIFCNNFAENYGIINFSDLFYGFENFKRGYFHTNLFFKSF